MDLHHQFLNLNFQIIDSKNKLIFLLLEIYEKEIYKKHGCATIFEYGFKFAKLSKETVQLALRTLKNTRNTPLVREKIATEGIYKVAMVAKLATPETDKIFAEHLEMPKEVLQQYAKEIRRGKEICHAPTQKVTIELDEETQILFNQLKKKYAKDLSNKEALKVILKNTLGHGIQKTSTQKTTNLLPSRTIPTAKKQEIQAKTNGKCAYPHCTKPIENFHHQIPFAFHRSHKNVVGLCKTHHEFCHHGLILNELKDPSQWQLSLEPHKSIYDEMYLEYKRSPRPNGDINE